MIDKKVGELWSYIDFVNDGGCHVTDVKTLIHKLIEERARAYRLVGDYTDSALRDFGIPEKEYNDGNNKDKV